MDRMENSLPKASKSRETVSVVIGSGGIRSLAALPLLEFLQNKKVPIDLLIGSGGGAALAGLFAAGYPLSEIPQMMAQIFDPAMFGQVDYATTLKILGLRLKPFDSPPAPYKKEPFEKLLKRLFQDQRLEDLPYRLIIQATDMATGHEMALSKGSLADCVYASNVIYPFLPPIEIENKWLAGGMFSGALPVITAVSQQMDIIFAVNASDETKLQDRTLTENVSNFLNRAFTYQQGRQTTLAISMHAGEIVLLNVGFQKTTNLWDVQYVPEILEAGKKTLAIYAQEIEDVLASTHSPGN